jgi:hypothetical protein
MTASIDKSSTSHTKAEDLGFQAILSLDAIKNLRQNNNNNNNNNKSSSNKGGSADADLYTSEESAYLSDNLCENGKSIQRYIKCTAMREQRDGSVSANHLSLIPASHKVAVENLLLTAVL